MKVLANIELAKDVQPREVLGRLDEEIRGSWRLFAAGVLREAYATGDPGRVVFVMEAADLKSAEDELRTLPLVQLGHFSFELTELRPFVNWSRLFSESHRQPLVQTALRS